MGVVMMQLRLRTEAHAVCVADGECLLEGRRLAVVQARATLCAGACASALRAALHIPGLPLGLRRDVVALLEPPIRAATVLEPDHPIRHGVGCRRGGWGHCRGWCSLWRGRRRSGRWVRCRSHLDARAAAPDLRCLVRVPAPGEGIVTSGEVGWDLDLVDDQPLVDHLKATKDPRDRRIVPGLPAILGTRCGLASWDGIHSPHGPCWRCPGGQASGGHLIAFRLSAALQPELVTVELQRASAEAIFGEASSAILAEFAEAVDVAPSVVGLDTPTGLLDGAGLPRGGPDALEVGIPRIWPVAVATTCTAFVGGVPYRTAVLVPTVNAARAENRCCARSAPWERARPVVWAPAKIEVLIGPVARVPRYRGVPWDPGVVGEPQALGPLHEALFR
mmetsp:Transcript_28026/g.77092  ORF Transcript_28026/g.77092 Transcript_28026/m.77092 type:complete len:391 (+) Transcript_28026:946-2118(+)